MPPTDATSIATRYLHAWTTGDFETARSLMHDDISFVGPLATIEGADEAMGGLRGMAQMVKGVDQRKVIADGEDICLIYDLVTTTPAGAVPTAGWYHVRDGKIDAIRVFFDTRPFGD